MLSQLDVQQENLRRGGIASIFDAQNAIADINQKYLSGELTKEQIKDVQVFREPRLQLLMAQTKSEIAQADSANASAETTRALLQPRIDQINSEIQRNRDLTGIERERLVVQRNEASARIAESQAGRRLREEELGMAKELQPWRVMEAKNRAQSFFPIEYKGEKAVVSAGDLLQAESTRTGRDERTEQAQLARIDKKADDVRAEIAKARDAEEKLLTLKTSPKSAKSPRLSLDEAQAAYNEFHQNSTDTYFYVPIAEPGGWFSRNNDRFEKYVIPKIGNTQATAREIFAAATASRMDVPTFMEKVIYPRAGIPVPWKNRGTTK